MLDWCTVCEVCHPRKINTKYINIIKKIALLIVAVV